MAIPCILTLEKDKGVITSEQDIVAYVIRHFFAQPAGATNTYRNTCASFREIAANNGTDTDALSLKVQGALSTILSRYFSNVRVLVSTTTPDSTGKYNLELRVSNTAEDGTETLILTDAKVAIKNGNVFNIAFTGATI